ncbi:MAG: phage tail protein, partial [Clostridiales bacterium]|nr:phage tail protein [Clostridiales bacterium]
MAAREIKTTLALDGEKQYKASLDDAYRAMRVLGSEMKATSAAFGDSGKSIDALRAKNDVLNKQIDQQKEIMASLQQAVRDSAAAYGENDKRTDAYRIRLNNAAAALSKMEGELNDNKKAIDGFGQETGRADKKTRDWGETLKKVGAVLGKATAVAAKATAAAIAAVGASAVAATKKLFDASKGAGVFADDLITLSQQTRISTDTLQKWSYASRFVDVEVETMTGSMARMIRNMDNARKGTGASAEAFQKLKIDITDANGQLRDSETVFMEAIDALGRVGNETERDAMAMALFGRSAQELNPLINAGSQALQELGQEAADAGLIMSDAALAQAGAF